MYKLISTVTFSYMLYLCDIEALNIEHDTLH